ncbi:cyclic lactone autoinducer peptide [Peptococcaceae bacterium 1198_IL3148]
MFKGLKTMALSSLAAALMFVAQTGITPYSHWVFFEPDVPKSLKK